MNQSFTPPPFLNRPEKSHFIGGKPVEPATGQRIESRNPATGQVLTWLARGNAADVDTAVKAARKAFTGPWSRLTPLERQALLYRVHELVEQNYEELALLESMDMGAPLSRTRSMKPFILNLILFFASQAMSCNGQTVANSLPGQFTTLLVKAPVGVVGGIIPWNGPLISQWWILGPALATGCTVVMKPAEDASLSVLRMAELVLQAGAPEGVINVVTGLGSEAGAALAEHPDVDRLAFTGSTETGRSIIRASAVNMKRLQLELGGKSPDIVFADADLDKAVPGAAMGVFNNSGQICYAGTRLFVQRSIHEEFVERLVQFAAGLKVGDPMDPAVQLGPLISGRQLERVMGYVDIGSREGAVLSGGGQRPGGALAGGYFIEPTVFSGVSNQMRIAREEIFGPVVSVIPFADEEEVLGMANDTDYGLGGAIWTQSLATTNRMMHGIKTGTLWVNCYGMVDPAVGFGGIKHSGYGWKGSNQHVDAFLAQKAVYINGG